MIEMTAEEYLRQQGGTGKRSKYGAQPMYVDGLRFSSKAEARRYEELKLLQQAGALSGLTCQPRYIIVDKSEHGRALYYVADFSYQENGREVVEDVKGGSKGEGTSTAVFRLKARLFRERYPHIELRVVGR